MSEPGKHIFAEFGGTAFLLAIVVGSGIMGQRLASGNDALALLANSIATGAGLYALITVLADAHFNPAVTLLVLWRRRIDARQAIARITAQIAGGMAGVLLAHGMFGEPLLQMDGKDRLGWPLVFAEFVATGGLLAVVSLAPRRSTAAAVAAYVTAAYWFTASTAFANPAVTIARALTASFAGISWSAVPGFIAAQLAAVFVVGLMAARRLPAADR